MTQITRRKNMVHIVIKQNPCQTVNDRHCIINCKDILTAKEFEKILVKYNELSTSTRWTTLDEAVFISAKYGTITIL